MLDLRMLRESSTFSTSGRARLAFVHHGFRSTRAPGSSRHPPLGLLALMRSLDHDRESGRLAAAPELRYFDETDYPTDEALAESVMRWLGDAQFRILLVGIYTIALERTVRFLRRFEAAEVCIVVGGPHVTVAPNIDVAHIAARGEGGAAVRHIVNHLLRPGFGVGTDATGLCYVDDGAATAGRVAFDRSLAELPSPAYDFTHAPGSTVSHWARDVGPRAQIYVCTQSCRARCTFCSTYLIHGRFVSRPAELVARDLAWMVDAFGYDAIEFHDDDLLQHDELDEVLEVLRSLPVRWSCNARAELIDEELARRMYAAGCRRVFLGIESMSQATLDYYNKRSTVADNTRAAHALHGAGIGVIAGYILGAPHDTLDSVLADIDRVLALPIYFLAASILIPDVGTVEYRRARKALPRLRLLETGGSHGVSVRPRPDLFGEQLPYGMPTVCDALSKPELNELYQLARCEFFLRQATREATERLTPSRRAAEVAAWHESLERIAVELANQATHPQVRERARGVLSHVQSRDRS